MSSSGALDAVGVVDATLHKPIAVSEVAACAQQLVEQQQFVEADQILRTLTSSGPGDPIGHILLASLAVRRSHWEEAVALWDAAFLRFGEHRDCFWHAMRATALTRLGQWQRALEDWEVADAQYDGAPKVGWHLDRTLVLVELELFDRARKTLPKCAEIAREGGALLIPLAQALTARKLYSETVILLEHATDALMHPGLLWPRLQSLIGLSRLAEARILFREALAQASSATVLILGKLAPQLFEDASLTATLMLLLERVRSLEGTSNEEPVTAELKTLRLRLHLALKDFDTFLQELARLEDTIPHHDLPGVLSAPLRAVATALRRKPRLDYKRRKVFGIGLSRTATSSLATALDILGYPTAHWSNPLTDQILDDTDLHLFDAFVDTPVCVAFEKNYFLFPASKFIYTTRDPAAWERSWVDYFERRWGCSDFRDARERITAADRFEYGRRFVDIHMTLYFNYDSYADAFRAYDRRVRDFFADKSPERFLILDICAGEGWEKLCRFLGHEVPGLPFPWQNRASWRDAQHA